MSTADSRQPLAGKRVLVTRAASQNDSLSQQLQQLGATVVAIPAIEFAPASDYGPLDHSIENLSSYDWLIFTSTTAVEFFFRRLSETGRGAGSLKGVRVAAVGTATDSRLKESGVTATLVPERFVAEGLLEALQEALRRENDSLVGKRILFPRARVARELFPEELQKRGAIVDVVEVYQTICPPSLGQAIRSALREGPFDLLIFTSSSTVANLAQALGARDLSSIFAGASVASLGPITSETARSLGLCVSMEPASSTVEDLVAAVTEYFSNRPTDQLDPRREA